MYPFLHKNKRFITNREKLEKGKERAMEITLKQGEMIYIPELWIYEQKSVNSSIILNFSEFSEDENIFEKISFFPLPIETTMNTKQKITLVKYCAVRIVSFLIDEQKSFFEFCDENPFKYIHQKIYLSRYHSLSPLLLDARFFLN